MGGQISDNLRYVDHTALIPENYNTLKKSVEWSKTKEWKARTRLTAREQGMASSNRTTQETNILFAKT